MKKRLIIYGVGETADMAYEYFTHDSDYEVVAFTVDRDYKTSDILHDLRVVDFEDVEQAYSPNDFEIFVAASYNQLNRVRTKMYQAAKAKKYNCASYISSRAFVWRNVVIGENAFILENNVLQHKVRLGNNVTLWSGNHIGHQTIIHDNVYISSHCVISGFCEVGESSFLGVNSTLNDNIKLGKDNLVASGALILRNTEDGKLMIGAPANPGIRSSFEAFGVNETVT